MIRPLIILTLFPYLAQSAAHAPSDVPAGAQLLNASQVRQLIVGAIRIGPGLSDGSPESTGYAANGSYIHTYNGIVPMIERGTYRITGGAVCERFKTNYFCFHLAKSNRGGYFMATRPQSRGRKWNWMSVRFERPKR